MTVYLLTQLGCLRRFFNTKCTVNELGLLWSSSVGLMRFKDSFWMVCGKIMTLIVWAFSYLSGKIIHIQNKIFYLKNSLSLLKFQNSTLKLYQLPKRESYAGTVRLSARFDKGVTEISTQSQFWLSQSLLIACGSLIGNFEPALKSRTFEIAILKISTVLYHVKISISGWARMNLVFW